MTKEEVINEFEKLRIRKGELPTLVEFIQQTDVSVEDLEVNFCPGNGVEGFRIMLLESSKHWL